MSSFNNYLSENCSRDSNHCDSTINTPGSNLNRVEDSYLYKENSNVKEELERAKRRFEVTSLLAHLAFWELDLQTNRLEWSDSIDILLGYSPGSFPRTLESWEDHLHPDDREMILKALDSHIKNGIPYDVEYRVRRKDGSYEWWRDIGSIQLDHCGHPTTMLGICIDITSRKLAEEEKQRLENE